MRWSLFAIALICIPSAFAQTDAAETVDPIVIYVSKHKLQGLYWTQEEGWWFPQKTYLKFFEGGTVQYHQTNLKPDKADKRMKQIAEERIANLETGIYLISDTEVTIYIDHLNRDTLQAYLSDFHQYVTLTGTYTETSVNIEPTEFAELSLTMQLWREDH